MNRCEQNKNGYVQKSKNKWKIISKGTIPTRIYVNYKALMKKP